MTDTEYIKPKDKEGRNIGREYRMMRASPDCVPSINGMPPDGTPSVLEGIAEETDQLGS